MRIQHNIMAMNAYRNYNTNTSALSKNLEKLSSGYKINRAGDDAAGLAISEKMRAQITGLDAAQKNVKDGVSLVKTAEGAMQEIQDMLNRMDYLATQSANGTYQDSVDRENLNKEMKALKTEIDRIADSANFNGIKLLDGSQAGQEAVEAGSYTYDVNGLSVTGSDRMLTSDIGESEKTYEVAGEKNIYDSVGAQPTTAKFHIDLKELAINNYGTAAGTIKSISITIGNLTLTATSVSVGSKGNVNTANVAASIATKMKAFATKAGGVASTVTINDVKWKVTASNGVLTFEQKAVASTDAKASANFDVKVVAGSVSFGSGSSANVSLDGGSLNATTYVDRAGVSINAGRKANTVFEVKETDIQDGAVFKIGDKTVTLRVGANSTVASGSNTVDLTDMEEGKINTTNGKLYVALSRISETIGSLVTDSQAKDIKGSLVSGVQLSVGVSRHTNAGVVNLGIGVHRVDSGSTAVYTDKSKLGNVFSITVEPHTVTVNTPAIAANSGGLTLQIGDTSDDFNQMKIRIGDMHVKAMGKGEYVDGHGNRQTSDKSIQDINISTQASAQEAVQVIRNAINYVSSIRGDLGAAQNRLEHTQNNLSVMAENIQDAESTIRDTDVADEMMKYVKNNILVQSAQAMLAQANQVPQGVLQLLG